MKKVNPKSTAKTNAASTELATKAVTDMVAPPLSKSELLSALVRVKRIEINAAKGKATEAFAAANRVLNEAWQKFGRSEVAKIDLTKADVSRQTAGENINNKWTYLSYFTVSTKRFMPDELPQYLRDAIAAQEAAAKHREECSNQVGRSDADLRREISAQIDAQSGKASRVEAVLKDPKASAALKDVLQKLANVPARVSGAPLTIET